MAEISTLNGYKIKDKKAKRYYDNINTMKADSSLKVGMLVETKGYYTSGDGGSGTYEIVNDTSLTSDNGSVHDLTNGLKAKLLINEGVNIKQFGAYGDGINEDSLYFQNCIDYLTNIIRASDIANENIINIPSGKYKISNKISLSPYIKLRTKGFVALLSYVTNGSTLHICPSANDLNQSIGDRQDWFRGPIINGDGGLIIKYMGDNNSNAIGIEIGVNQDIPNGVVSRFSMQEFRLQGFNIGMLFNRYHVYLSELRRISFENNTIGVQYGDNQTAPVDSGEKMSYIECLFARNDISVKWLCQGFDSTFIDTSFDFNKCVFYDINNKGYRYINVSCCHFEGIGINNKSDMTIPSGIVYGQMRSSKINIIQSDMFLTYVDYLFYCDSSLSPDYVLTFSNNKLCYPTGQNKTGLYFLATNNINILGIDNSNIYGESAKFIQLKKSIFNYDFSDMELGEFTFDNVTKKIGEFVVPNKNSEISNTMEIITSPFGKALKLTKTSNTQIYFRINTGLFPVIGGRSVITNICKNIISQTYITIKYYDYDKNLLGQTSDYHYESNEKDGDMYMSDWVKRLYVPSNAYYLEVSYSSVVPADVTNYTIYGMFVQYE